MALRVRNVGGPGLVVAVRGPGCLGVGWGCTGYKREYRKDEV